MFAGCRHLLQRLASEGDHRNGEVECQSGMCCACAWREMTRCTCGDGMVHTLCKSMMHRCARLDGTSIHCLAMARSCVASHVGICDIHVMSMCDQVTGLAGVMELSDLEGYRAVYRRPVHTTYRGYDVYSMPLPSSGGITLMQVRSCHDSSMGRNHGAWHEGIIASRCAGSHAFCWLGMSCHVMSCDVMSCHVMCCPMMSSHVVCTLDVSVVLLSRVARHSTSSKTTTCPVCVPHLSNTYIGSSMHRMWHSRIGIRISRIGATCATS